MDKEIKKKKSGGAPRYNKNAQGKRVERERIIVNLSISKKNELLELFSEYLCAQGVQPTDEEIKKLAGDWAYLYWEERLKRELEQHDAAIIL